MQGKVYYNVANEELYLRRGKYVGNNISAHLKN